jgi:hypothetical protein
MTNEDIFNTVAQEAEMNNEIVEDVMEQEVEQEPAIPEPSIDDLPDKSIADMHRVITIDDEIPEGTVFTIKEVRLRPPHKDAKILESKNGLYIKEKLELKFEEKLGEDKIRVGLPSIFYSVSEDKKINPIPSIPKACEDEDLEDNFTPELSKLRNLYCKFVDKDPRTVSNKEFVKGLIGKKVEVYKKTGKYDGRKYAVLRIKRFVK